MFFAQITCVCAGGWRQIWDLPTVQLISGFLIRVTGKSLELGDPCPPGGGKKKNKKPFRLQSDFTLMKLLNFMMKIFHIDMIQTSDPSMTKCHKSDSLIPGDILKGFYHHISIHWHCSFVLTGCHGDSLWRCFPVPFLFWLIARPFFTQMWGMFGLRGVKTSPVQAK